MCHCGHQTCTTNVYYPALWQGSNSLILLRKSQLAGAVGFEPTVHDTKNRCLTTWPRPISVCGAENSVPVARAQPSI